MSPLSCGRRWAQRGCGHSTRRLGARARAFQDPNAQGKSLASEFARLTNESKSNIGEALRVRRPSPFLSPTATVAAQLNALQMNDWPEADDGIRAAFLFSRPYDCEGLVPGHVVGSGRARCWGAHERWLDLAEFGAELRELPYSSMLNCESWQPTAPLKFPSVRYEGRAVQAVRVISQHQDGRKATRERNFTWCLERIEVGPYKGCWMTVGVRVGDYGSV